MATTYYYPKATSHTSHEQTMPTSNTSYSRSRTIPAVTADDDSSINDAVFEILPENIPNTIITKAPEERFKLGTFTVICLVVNRVIGTGIFNSPTTVIKGTQSVGVTLLFWFAGSLFTICGAYMVIEFGLTIPRYFIDGVEQSVPRSGGILNYLQYIYPRPAYRPGSILLITCIFGACYIILGNMAGNCLVFGIRCIEAAGFDSANYDSAVRGIAVGVATFACLIHTFSRRGGIYLGNFFAVIKVLLLTMMIIVGFCAWGGAFGTENYATHNMAAQNAFKDPSSDSYGYVSAFLSVIFAWSGFDQPTYVLGEIKTPRKKFPLGTSIGVAIVCVLYLLVNVAYMIVVPRELQLTSSNVAREFFKATLGHINPENSAQPQRILSAFMAISSFGNIMVMTFIAARVKQEIAKEGVLPWAKYFGQSRNFSFGRLLYRIQRNERSFFNRNFSWLLKQRWMNPAEHTQETPFGALTLHWFFTMIMIIATIRLTPSAAYSLLVNLYSYTIVCVFGVLLSVGMLKLRFSKTQQWRKKSRANPFLSITAAVVFLIGSAYPVIASWVPPTGVLAVPGPVPWFTTPTVGFSIIGLGGLWYLAFIFRASRRNKKEGLEFRVQKIPEFDRDAGDGLPVQVHETVYLAWAAKEAQGATVEVESRSSHESF